MSVAREGEDGWFESLIRLPPLTTNATMNETIQLRQQNLDATEKMAQFESPDGDDICASYVDRSVADQLGEFAEVTITDDAEVSADLTNTTANYAVYETPSGAVTGLYISKDVFDADAPESIGLSFAPSTEEEWGEAEEVDENEVEGLLSDSDESDEDEAEDIVEIEDEDLDLPEQ